MLSFFLLLLLLLSFPPFPLLCTEDGGKIMKARFRDARSRYIYNNPCKTCLYTHKTLCVHDIHAAGHRRLLLRLLLSGSNQLLLLPPLSLSLSLSSSLEIFSSDTGKQKRIILSRFFLSSPATLQLLFFVGLLFDCDVSLATPSARPSRNYFV